MEGLQGYPFGARVCRIFLDIRMPSPHPVIALYCAKQCPDEDVVLAALRSCAQHPALRDQQTIVNLAVLAGHWGGVLEEMLVKSTPGAERGRLLCTALALRPDEWFRDGGEWFDQLDHMVPGWTSDLLQAAADGLSGWDVLLAKSFGISCTGSPNAGENALLARIAACIEDRHPELFPLPHPALPSASRAQVWGWLWASIPFPQPRLHHWGYLLGCGIDPDFSMEVSGGRMSMGSTLLWGVHPDASLPKPAGWCLEDTGLQDLQPTPKWIDLTRKPQEFTQAGWAALWMLRQAGMDPTRLEEPTLWRTPALGLLARCGEARGQWSPKMFSHSKEAWLGLGLDFGASSTHQRTLLDVAFPVLLPALEGEETPSPAHWSISPSAWDRAATPAALARFWNSPACLRLLEDEPRLRNALLQCLCEGFAAWGDVSESSNLDIQAVSQRLPLLSVIHPLTPLGGILMDYLHAQDMTALAETALRMILAKIPADFSLTSIKEVAHRARLMRLVSALRNLQHPTLETRHEFAQVLREFSQRECSPIEPSPPPDPDLIDMGTQEAQDQLVEVICQAEEAGECTPEGLDFLARLDVSTITVDFRESLADAISFGPSSPLIEAFLRVDNNPPKLSSGRVGSYHPALATISLDMLSSSPRLMHALIYRLSTLFALGHAARMRVIADHIECAQVLPRAESEVLDAMQGAEGSALICLALRMAALAAEKEDLRQKVDTIGLWHRSRPASPKLSSDIAEALLAWLDPLAPTLACQAETFDRQVIQTTREIDPKDTRPVVLLYTQDALRDFGAWSATRIENDAVKSWRKSLLPAKADNAKDPAYRHRARRLSMAHPAVAALAELRAGFPHFEDVIHQIESHLCLALRGDASFSLPPLLMTGPPGTGKTFFFQELASKVATTYQVLPMESITGGFSIVGMDCGWSGATPGIVFHTLMADGATANPILLLDEIDKVPSTSNAPVGPVLLGLLEPHSAKRFVDRCVGLQMDASRINWVATANDLARVDLPVRSRFNIVHVANPDYHARCAMSRHIYQALRSTHIWGKSFELHLSEETIQTLARPANAARDLRKNLTSALAIAARANRGQLLPSDIPLHALPPPLSPWDAPLPELPPNQNACQEAAT